MVDVLIDDRLFVECGGATCLAGSRCNACGQVTFPVAVACPRCRAEHVLVEALPRRGALWSWTVQSFRPKSPPYAGDETVEEFVPFGVGYVELPGALLVEARLTESDPARLRIGMEMELVLVPCGRDAAGDGLLTFAFQPC